MRSDASSNNPQFNRKSVISSHSTGSSNNEVSLFIPNFHITVSFIQFIYLQTTAASISTNKNYKSSQTSASKQTQPQQQQRLPFNYRSSMSSHSDIFMKADEQKINFGNFFFFFLEFLEFLSIVQTPIMFLFFFF